MAYESPVPRDARIDITAVLGAVIRRLPRIIVVTLLLLAVTFVLLMFSPRLYESSSSILVEPRSNAYVRASNEQAPTLTGGEAGVVSSQIELIQSRDTLLKVIDQLDLRSVPEFNGSQGGFSPLGMLMRFMGRSSVAPVSVDEVVLNNLYARMTVIQERDSRIISILVRSVDPELAAKIANAVANAHVARRAELSISDTAEASSWLRDEIARLQVKVKDAESAVAQFKVDNDLFTGQNNTSLLDQQLSTIASQITDAQQRRNTASSRATLIRGLIDRGQPIEGVADVRDSVVIQQLSEEKARLQAEIAQKSATLLSNHPTIRAMRAQVSELNSQIEAEGRRVAAALDAEAQIEDGVISSLQAELARTKTNASTATKDTVTLDSLQRDAKAQRDLLESYLARYNEASSRVDSNSALPDVRVVSFAAPSVTPASPKTSLIMTAVALVSLLLQIGAIIFGELISGRAIVPIVAPELPQDELEAMPFREDELEPDQAWEEPELEEMPDDAVVASAELADPETEIVAIEPLFDEEVETVDDDLEPVDHDVIVDGEESDPPVEPERAAETEVDAQSVAAREFIRSLMAGSRVAPDEVEAEVRHDHIEPDYVEAVASAGVADVAETTVPEAQEAGHGRAVRILSQSDLVADLVLGRTHLLLLADHGDGQPGHHLAEELVGEALAKGLSVALVDAGTGIRSEFPGMTDLSAGTASFGEVVQKSADNSFAEVVWGQGESVEKTSPRPLTLVEALGDIYEVVVVLTGRLGRHSSLARFLDLDGRVVLVTGEDADLDGVESARERLVQAGVPRVEIAALPETEAA